MKIATGGALPRRADSVVMFEQTQAVDEATIEVVKPVGPLENVIRRGEDIRKGEIFLNRGQRLRPQDLAALAGVGIMQVTVYQKPKVALLSTGNEIVPAQSIPGPGQIRDSNSYSLEGLVTLAGGAPVRRGIIPDDYEQLRTAVHSAVGACGMVLMTGGSSVGTADLSAKVINEAGSPGVLVHGVAIKPGKPLIIGLAGSEERPVPIFGLPGHPAAVTICFELFVRPILTRLTGEVPHPALEGVAPNRSVKARLARSISSSPGREEHVRVMLERREDGLWARPVFGASGLITTLVRAVGTVVVPVSKIGIEAGEDVDVILF
jgi:molybdopterin molybdotransferase